MAFTQISGDGLKDNSITNAHLHSGANIAASKLANSGVTAGSYGSASLIPAITVNAQGLVTSLSTNSFTTTDNNFTDALLSKLNGIANNANNVTNYVTDDASDILAGDTYTFLSSTSQKIVLSGATNPYIRFQEGTTNKAYIQWHSDNGFQLVNEESGEYIQIQSGNNGFKYVVDGTARNVFHSGNSNFVTADAGDTLTGGTYTFSNAENQKIILSGATNPYIRFQEGTTNKAYIQWDSAGVFQFVNQESGENLKIGSGNFGLQYTVDGTVRNVLHSGNVSTYALPISGGTLTGDLITDDLIVGNGSGQTRLFLQKADNNVSDHIIFYNGTARVAEIGVEDGSWLRLNQETAANVYTPRMIRADGGFQVGAGTDIKFTNGDWSGNHCKIQHHSNYLYIIGGANGIIFREGGTSRWYIDGNGHLYPNGSGNYNIGNSNNHVNNIYALDIYASGGAGAVTINGGSDIRFSSGTWTGEATCKLQLHSNVLYLQAPAFLFRDDGGTNRWSISSSGHLIPYGNANYHIGDGSNRVNNIYANALFLGQSTRYLSNASADYGSVQINGSGQNGWEGFSIDGRAVFMHNGSTSTGLYNDVNNEWLFYSLHNDYSAMYFNGSQKIKTENYGCKIAGTCRPHVTNGGDSGASDARWGTVYASNGSINTSDRNEKNTIIDSDLGLNFINKLKAVSYKWNDEELGKKTHYGLIAQDIEETIKEIGKDVDNIGMIDKPEKGAMGLNYNELIAPLVKAIQELSTKVAALEAA